MSILWKDIDRRTSKFSDTSDIPPYENDKYLHVNSEGKPEWASVTIPDDIFSTKLLHIQDQKTAGTHGGTFNSGAWRTRDLNTTLTNEITDASLATNAISLPTGTYYCEASAPARAVNAHKTRLRKTNGTASDLLIGTTEFAEAAYNGYNRSFVSGRFALTETSTIELQHYCNVSLASTGFGYAAAIDSKPEIYSDIKIWKIT